MTVNHLLLKFARRSSRLIALTVILGFAGALFNGISTALIVPVILAYLGQGQVLSHLPSVLQKLLQLTGAQGEQQLLLMMGLIIFAILIKNAATYTSLLVSARLTQTLSSSIRKEGLQMLLDVDLEFYHRNKAGDLLNQLGGEVMRTADSVKVAIQMLTTSITLLVFIGILVSLSWQLTLIATGLSLLVSLLSQFFIYRAKCSGKKLSAVSARYSVALLEMLSGMRLIKASSQEKAQYEKLVANIEARELAECETQANYAIISPMNEMTGIVTVLVIVIAGKALFAAQMQSLSTLLLMYLLTLFRMLPMIGQLNTLRSQFANTSPSVQVVSEFLRRDRKPIMSVGYLPYRPMQQGIRFEAISFRYPSNDDWTLQDVTLDLPKGTTLALVGSSGAGKSTLADLLPRFYDCNEGCILIDGQDIRSLDVGSLRSAMGIVSQDTFLFSATVFDNIAFGCIDASDEDVVAAAKRANAYEFIQQLPEGFQTQVGDRGVMLSGGQRQRLAIARALLRNPEILILDEATSALDTVSERLVQQAIDDLSRDRTVLVIAHRLSTIQNADQIAVFHQGRVVEVGTHHELLEQNGHYARLYDMQFDNPTATLPPPCEPLVVTKS
jgi:subfamily B ATP-binding cassette protein MsbA